VDAQRRPEWHAAIGKARNVAARRKRDLLTGLGYRVRRAGVSDAETLEYQSGTKVPPAFEGAAYAPISANTRGKLRWLPVEQLLCSGARQLDDVLNGSLAGHDLL
jgi:hypothetical protein